MIEIDYELELMADLEVSHFRLVSGFDERFETVLYELQKSLRTRTVCSPNRSVSVSSRNVVLIAPAQVPPIALA